MSDVQTRNPRRWGLDLDLVEDLGLRLYRFWERYHPCFCTTTRDTSGYALTYLKGLLVMQTDRNYSQIAWEVEGSDQNR